MKLFIFNLLSFAIVSFALFSCYQNPKKISYINTNKDSLIHTSEKLDLTITQPKSNNCGIPTSWKQLGSIQQNWIEVKKDKEGYLIYEPCDGETPTIRLRKGNLLVKPQIEPETTFIINKISISKNNTALTIDVYPGNDEEISTVSAKIIEPKNGLVLWKVGNEKLIMTPVENAINFRRIKNDCPDHKREELEFIEYQAWDK